MQETATVLGVLAVFAMLLSMANYKKVWPNVSARFRELSRPSPLQLLPVLLFAAIVVGSAWYYSHLTPPMDYVDGVYKSACCPDVTIHHGEVLMGAERAKLRLHYVKYGLSGKLDKPIGPLFTLENGEKSPVEIVFEKGGSFYVADYRLKDVVYRRQSPQQP